MNQYEGAEALFLELMPFGAKLTANGILSFYATLFETSCSAGIDRTIAEALKEQFKVKAWKVIELVQRAKDSGDPEDRVHLLRTAASLPGQESALSPEIGRCCRYLLTNGEVPAEDVQLLFSRLTQTEARVLIGAAIFSVSENDLLPIQLQRILWHIKSEKFLDADDPFVSAGDLAISAMAI